MHYVENLNSFTNISNRYSVGDIILWNIMERSLAESSAIYMYGNKLYWYQHQPAWMDHPTDATHKTDADSKDPVARRGKCLQLWRQEALYFRSACVTSFRRCKEYISSVDFRPKAASDRKRRVINRGAMCFGCAISFNGILQGHRARAHSKYVCALTVVNMRWLNCIA